jgi:CheY-like chemotaxis protein
MNKKKVMIADDDPAIIEVVKMMLEEEGYEVETTVMGAVVRNLREDLPGLLLLDIRMSGMDGKEICKHLKNQPTTRHIPIVFLSANKDIARIALESGADDFIAKPFDMSELIGKVEQYL